MKKTLLFVLALIAAGCAPAEQSETPPEGSEQVTPSASCADITVLSSLEDVRTCAEQGDARVQFMLGDMYAAGNADGQVDDAEAVRWYRLAAEQGVAEAQRLVGSAYQFGRGVPEDDVLAYMWYNLAATQENRARLNKDIIEQQMTREQIAEAQRMSREWIEAHPPGSN
jgi:TPR repeat protein